jgi:Ferredoxin
MVTVSVDNGLCQAHGQCNLVDDELFTVDDEGYSNIGKDKPVPDGMEDSADQGVYSCPVQALSLAKD